MDDNFKNIIQSKFDNMEGTPPVGGFAAFKNKVPPTKEPFFNNKKAKYLLLPLLFFGSVGLFLGGYYFGQKSIAENTISTSINQQLLNEDKIAFQFSSDKNDSESFIEASNKNVLNNAFDKNQVSNNSIDNNLHPTSQNSTLISKNRVNNNLFNPVFLASNSAFSTINKNIFKPYENSNKGNHTDSSIVFFENKEKFFTLSSIIGSNSDDTPWGIEVFLPKNEQHLNSSKEDINTIQNVHDQRFIYGFYASILNNHKNVNANQNDNVIISEFNKTKSFTKEKLGYDFGLNVKYILTPNLLFGIGVDISQINDKVAYTTLGNTKTASSEIVSNNELRVNFNNNTIKNTQNVSLLYAGLNTNLEYIFAPRFSIITGVGYTQTIPYGETKGIVSNNIRTNLAIAYNTSIAPNWKMQVQPTFNYYFKKSIDEDFSVKPYNFGLRLNFLKK